mmetsp:Transcript_55958/g.149202  ORF Transcript_55958/g.149202 Transcript_55958/m.149202 type:complete len:255 (-) Transcript_55958:1231-1995(-)
MTKLRMPFTIRSGRKHRSINSCWNGLSELPYFIGIGDASGASSSYQSCQTFGFLVRSSARVANSSSRFFSICMSFQPASVSHSTGFFAVILSRDGFPFKKKSQVAWSSSPSPSIILEVICSENISLCLSKIPKHVYSYMVCVIFSRKFFKRLSMIRSGLASLSATSNTPRKDVSEYSYMLSIMHSPAMAKYKMEPRLATFWYKARVFSISADVFSALSSAAAISVDLTFALFRVSISSLSSRMDPCEDARAFSN